MWRISRLPKCVLLHEPKTTRSYANDGNLTLIKDFFYLHASREETGYVRVNLLWTQTTSSHLKCGLMRTFCYPPATPEGVLRLSTPRYDVIDKIQSLNGTIERFPFHDHFYHETLFYIRKFAVCSYKNGLYRETLSCFMKHHSVCTKKR